jgi:hypothetical protein
MRSRSTPSIHLVTDVDSYFETELREITRRQGVTLSPLSTRYLARMLSKFTETRAYLVEHEGKLNFPRLAQLWMEGFTKTAFEQSQQFQYLGDFALFTSGFFSERINRSLVDMDYYIAMGGQAYQRAGHLRESLQAERSLNVFFELSATFTDLVEVLSELSDQALLANDKDILKLYERWLVNGSERVRRMLAENGVIPSPKRAVPDERGN